LILTPLQNPEGRVLMWACVSVVVKYISLLGYNFVTNEAHVCQKATNALSGKITATVTFRREDLARRKQAADRFSNVLANLSVYRHPHMAGSGKKTMGHGILFGRSLIFWKIILRYRKALGRIVLR
jgi:hypothetical protein